MRPHHKRNCGTSAAGIVPKSSDATAVFVRQELDIVQHSAAACKPLQAGGPSLLLLVTVAKLDVSVMEWLSTSIRGRGCNELVYYSPSLSGNSFNPTMMRSKGAFAPRPLSHQHGPRTFKFVVFEDPSRAFLQVDLVNCLEQNLCHIGGHCKD